MGHCSGEDIRDGLQIHGHESSVGSSQAPHLLVIDVRMFGTEALGSLYDVIGSIFTISIDMTCSKLLSETCTSTGLNDVDHIAHGSPVVEIIIRIQIASYGRTSAIIINQHGIFLARIEVWRQIISAIYSVASAALEIPFAEFTQFDIAQSFGIVVMYERLLILLQVHRIYTICIGGSFA